MTADIQSIDAAPHARVYAVLHGDIHIRNGAPVYQFEPARLRPQAIPGDAARYRPSWLLAAENQIVGFSGRGEELEALSQWRDSSRTSVSVQLLHGPGGQGKSRLAAEFAARSAASGWSAWAAHHVSDSSGRLVAAPGEPGAQLLLLVDYAERWPLDDLVLMLGNAALRRPQRVRVLLVARTADVWWPALWDAIDAFAADVGQPLRLRPLAGTVVDRRALFVAAYRSFADLLGVPPGSVSTPDDRTLRDYDLVLTMHMAALAAVDARRHGASPPADPVGLSRYLLDREYDFWQTLYDHGRSMVADPVVMGRLVHTTILTRSVLPAQGVSIVVQLGITPAGSASRALRDHAACYQPAAQTRGTVLEPLYPDRLAEDFLALHSPGHDIADYAADDWSQSVPVRLFDHDASTAPTYARKALASLIEVARRWPHVAERQLHPLLRDRPELAVSAGGAALASLAAIPDADRGRARCGRGPVAAGPQCRPRRRYRGGRGATDHLPPHPHPRPGRAGRPPPRTRPPAHAGGPARRRRRGAGGGRPPPPTARPERSTPLRPPAGSGALRLVDRSEQARTHRRGPRIGARGCADPRGSHRGGATGRRRRDGAGQGRSRGPAAQPWPTTGRGRRGR